MSASVHVLRESKATPEQVLADALDKARKGEIRDVIVIGTGEDGTMDVAQANCTAADLALAALLLADKAREKALG